MSSEIAPRISFFSRIKRKPASTVRSRWFSLSSFFCRDRCRGRRRGRQRMNAQSREDGKNRDGESNGVDGSGAAESGIGKSSYGGSGDVCDLIGAGIPGHGVGKMFFRNQLWQNGAAYRKAEAAGDRTKNQDYVDQVN